MRFIATAMASLVIAGSASAASHPCAEDARTKAGVLLSLHFSDNKVPEMQGENQSIADEVTALPPIKALSGTGKFDVLEVWGYIYKASYRMRFIYAQIPDTCVLMGQEILEDADPY